MLDDYTVIDLEMTGLRPTRDAVLEVGAVQVRSGKVKNTYGTLVYTEIPLPEKIIKLTGITREMADTGKNPDEVMAELLSFIGEDIIVGHNVIFDYGFLKQWAINHNRDLECSAVDTLKLARGFLAKEQKKDLGSLCEYFHIPRQNAHRALDDAIETHLLLEHLKDLYGRAEGADILFAPEPLSYKAKKQTPATKCQKAQMEKYACRYGISLPQNYTVMTRSEASRLIDRWIGQYGKL